MSDYRETILRVGGPVPLHGVMTIPREQSPDLPTLIILNSGLLHHVGSCCLSVLMCRDLARRGFTAVRFDVSGIGDSSVRRSTEDHLTKSDNEVIEVMDAMEKHGSSRFVLMGLCSGAAGSYRVALRDSRVIAVAQIAPVAYRTPRWYLNHYLPRIGQLHPWLNAARNLKSTLKQLFGLRPAAADYGLADFANNEIDWGENPTRAELADGYRELLQRQVRLLVIFTAGEANEYNYLGQFREMLPGVPFGEWLQESYYPETTHIITEPEDQTLILREIQDWIANKVA